MISILVISRYAAPPLSGCAINPHAHQGVSTFGNTAFR